MITSIVLLLLALAIASLAFIREEGLMTRKGHRQRPWSDEEIRYLCENLGKKPLARIAKDLKRSEKSVYRRADRMRDTDRSLSWCSCCHCLRTSVNKAGKCKVCITREKRASTEAIATELIERLDPETREHYISHEQFRGSRKDDLPEKLTAKKQLRSDMGYLMREEVLELAYETRRYNASKTRLKRIRKDLGISPRGGM